MAGPGDPHASRSQDNGPAHRRRSSVAYDPARDTFTEIPENTLPDVIDESASHKPGTSPIAETSEPSTNRMSSPESNKRRRRSTSTEPQYEIRKDSNIREEPAQKRRRPSNEELQAMPNHSTANGTQNGSVSTTGGLSKSSRMPQKFPNNSQGASQSQRSQSPGSNRDLSRGQNARYNNNNNRRRSRSPPPRRQDRARDVYRRRSPPRPRQRDPSRSPSPIRSPPRQGPIIRPGGARGRGRNVLAEQQRLAAEREAKQAQQAGQPTRGVQDVSNQFYNARPEWVRERGRDWRRNESKIKGLRSFNNWIKSCLIQKFSPEEKTIGQEEELGWGEQSKEPEATKPLLILDIGFGKGGDLGKWQLAPQTVGLYVGLDPAKTSVRQASERYREMRNGRRPVFDARFVTQDCFGEWIGNVSIVQEVGIDPSAGNGQIQRWGGGGGFDVVAMMFSMHYAFESEDRVRMMLRNTAGALKKGGRFIGVVPNSDVLAARIREWYAKHPDQAPKPDENGNLIPAKATSTDHHQQQSPHKEKEDDDKAQPPPPATTVDSNDDNTTPSWGNSIYNVRFPPQSDPTMILSPDGTFRPPFGWKYTYWMDEAVDVPEFVVPWEAFRAIAEQFGLEQRYRRGFLDIWETETKGDDPVSRELAALALRMGVAGRGGDGGGDGGLLMSDEEKEAVSFYHAFCFVKV